VEGHHVYYVPSEHEVTVIGVWHRELGAGAPMMVKWFVTAATMLISEAEHERTP